MTEMSKLGATQQQGINNQDIIIRGRKGKKEKDKRRKS
jgi:hypothetical protein